MFADTLLESSPTARKNKRWPMATAFTLETIIAALVIIVPLLSTGVIPVSARMQIIAPLTEVRLEPRKPVPTDTVANSQDANSNPRPMAVVLVNNNRDTIQYGKSVATTNNPDDVRPGDPSIANNNDLPDDLVKKGNGNGPVNPGPGRIVSNLSEAQLINRVEPVYPRPAILAGVQGQVKLHAIIARDGRVTSLNVISGSPLLVHAAMDAVSQWRYRPYYLNGQAVEVETFITVNFRREGR